MSALDAVITIAADEAAVAEGVTTQEIKKETHAFSFEADASNTYQLQ